VGVSLIGHALVVGALVITSGWGMWSHALTPVKLVYEDESDSTQTPWTNEVTRIQVGLREASVPNAALPQSAVVAGYHPGPIGPNVSLLVASSEAGDGFGGHGMSSVVSDSTTWGSAIDLTNLTQTFQGNPVLYAYFSAIRERIQRTANDQSWLPMEAAASGTVYVGFVLNRMGTMEVASVISDRSVESPLLQEVALRIVKASGPFLPFPPSFPESSKAIVVPIEFSSES